MNNFKFNKADLAGRDEIVQSLAKAKAELDEAIKTFNEGLAALREPLKEAEAAYNEVLQEARDYTARIGEEIDDAINDKSEAWQEGDRGSAAAEMRDAWQGYAPDDVSLEIPEDLDGVDDLDHDDTLSELATELDV